MATGSGYSNLFSLGLSSIPFSHDAAYHPQSSSSASSMSASASGSTFYLLAQPPKIQINTQLTPARQRTRRRRSSLTQANSPLCSVKSPERAANASLSRVILCSPVRTRAPPARRADNEFIQRLRSSSMGEILRSRRGPTRKPAPAPTTPPPDLPLPAVPTKGRPASSPPSDGLITAAARLSLSAPSPAPSFGSSQVMLTPGFVTKLAQALATPPSSGNESPIDPMMSGRSYFEEFTPIDDEMKEN
ncbi:hypothetical protein M0805_009907 [Coniferiporia weirii]|nr:hypothetical protein M0805_009907 [Coniferiporia weirii]